MKAAGMKILVYSETNSHSVATNLGAPEYSYYFVLRAFLPVLQKFGDVHVVNQPQFEVDEIYRRCQLDTEACVFLSFSAPHKTLTMLECPTFCVFAWEFDDIPNESWGGDLSSDWQKNLSMLSGAITHSRQTELAVKRLLGEGYPIVSIPAPIWSRVTPAGTPINSVNCDLEFDGVLFDAREADWARIARYLYWDRKEDRVWLTSEKELGQAMSGADTSLGEVRKARSWASIIRRRLYALCDEVLSDLLPRSLAEALASQVRKELEPVAEPRCEPASSSCSEIIPEELGDIFSTGFQRLRLDGVVYCSVLNPEDGRKNIKDLISAFCIAFKNTKDATLIIKLTHSKPERALSRMIAEIYRSAPFDCRVVLLSGYLSDEGYSGLINATKYVVNTSFGEGQCLPLMEFMSRGKPAIAPSSSAMADYITKENAFVVESSREMTSWPHDPRQAYRTYRYRPHYESLLAAYKESFEVAFDGGRYEKMSIAARSSLQRHCGDDEVLKKLASYFGEIVGAGRVCADNSRSRLNERVAESEGFPVMQAPDSAVGCDG